MDKIQLENTTDNTSKKHFGMSSALGATPADLPTDVPMGSDAFDYTTQTVYFFDGVSWK